MLNGELENLDKLKQDEESKLIEEIKAINESMQRLANPAKGPPRKMDLYKMEGVIQDLLGFGSLFSSTTELLFLLLKEMVNR